MGDAEDISMCKAGIGGGKKRNDDLLADGQSFLSPIAKKLFQR